MNSVKWFYGLYHNKSYTQSYSNGYKDTFIYYPTEYVYTFSKEQDILLRARIFWEQGFIHSFEIKFNTYGSKKAAISIAKRLGHLLENIGLKYKGDQLCASYFYSNINLFTTDIEEEYIYEQGKAMDITGAVDVDCDWIIYSRDGTVIIKKED